MRRDAAGGTVVVGVRGSGALRVRRPGEGLRRRGLAWCEGRIVRRLLLLLLGWRLRWRRAGKCREVMLSRRLLLREDVGHRGGDPTLVHGHGRPRGELRGRRGVRGRSRMGVWGGDEAEVASRGGGGTSVLLTGRQLR